MKKINQYLETTKQVLFAILLGSLLTFTLIFGIRMENLFNKPIQIDFEDINKELSGELIEFIKIAERFAENHTYIENVYDCNNYTDDLKYITDNLGFTTLRMHGCTNNESEPCHAWLRLLVDFEPINAEFADYSEKYPIQRVIR